MPLRTEVIDLEAERDDLQERLADLEDRLAELEADDAVDPTDDAYQTVLQERNDVEQRGRGVHWALEEAAEGQVDVWDEDADEITLGGLHGGEYYHVVDEADGVGLGGSKVHYVAAGTVDAPYADADTPHEDAVVATRQLPPAYLKWAERKIDELTSVGNGFGARSRDSATDRPATSTETPGSST